MTLNQNGFLDDDDDVTIVWSCTFFAYFFVFAFCSDEKGPKEKKTVKCPFIAPINRNKSLKEDSNKQGENT